MAKTLVIAEKPSVGQDLARVLPGPFEKHTGAGDKTARWLEGPDHVITWAVGHLVQLAEPDEYDDKFKKWRMADLPIVPDRFKLVVRDERSKKQMSVVTQELKRGNPITIPAKISSEIPFPMPRSVICSPSHITKIVPVVRVITIIAVAHQPSPIMAFRCSHVATKKV